MPKKKAKKKSAKRTTIAKQDKSAVNIPEMAKRVKLSNICLWKCSAERTSQPVGSESPDGKVRITFAGEAHKNDESNKHWIDYKVDFFISIKSPSSEVLDVSAKYQCLYTFIDGIAVSEEEINEFGKVVVLINSWPYWREFVQSVTTRMGLPPLTLPLFSPDSVSGWQRTD